MSKSSKKSSTSAKGSTEAVFLRPALYSAVIVLLVIVAVQITRTSIVLENVGRTNNALIHELGQMREGLIKVGDDLNSVQEYLALPSEPYNFFPKEEPKADALQEDPIGSALFKFTDEIGKTHLKEKALEAGTLAIQNLRKDKAFLSGLSELNLGGAKLVEDGAKQMLYSIYRDKDVLLATLNFSKTTADFTMESILGISTLKWTPESDLGTAILDFLKANKDIIITLEKRILDQKEAFKTLVQQEGITPLLQEKRLQVNFTPVETSEGFEFSITNADTESVLTLRIERKTGDFLMGEDRFEDAEELEKPLTQRLEEVSGETERDKQVASHQKSLDDYLKDETFLEILAANELEMSGPKEEGNRRTWELKNKGDQTLLGSIIFETLTGNLRFLRASDQAELSLDEILGDGLKKKP